MAGSTCHGPRGGQTPGQQGLTRRRFVAGGNRRGGGLGLAPPASKWTEESGYGELELTRARFSKQQQLGRPETTAPSLAAAAGARACSVSALHSTAGAADGLYGMLGSPGIPGGNERRRRSSGARSSPAMADGGFGCSWGGGYRAQSKGEKGRGGVGAHSGAVGMVSRLGGAPEWPNRRRRSSAAGEGKTSGLAFRGSSGRVTRRGGRGRTGGASRGVGEARGGRWPWVRRR